MRSSFTLIYLLAQSLNKSPQQRAAVNCALVHYLVSQQLRMMRSWKELNLSFLSLDLPSNDTSWSVFQRQRRCLWFFNAAPLWPLWTALFPIAFTKIQDEARKCKWDGDLPWELGGILLVFWRTVKESGAKPAEGNSEPSQPGRGGSQAKWRTLYKSWLF